MKLLVAVLLLLISLATPVIAQKTSPDPGAEVYAVYSALIREYIGARQDRTPNLVIETETTDYPHLGGTRIEDCVKPEAGEEAQFEAMIRDYKAANKTPDTLKDKFDLPYKYQLVSRSLISTIFIDKQVDGWKAFYDKYPNSDGYLDMSAVAFSPDRTIALVYLGHHCGWLCGDGTYHIMRKEDGKWTRSIWSRCDWVS
jgi:hypothetical protein